MAASRIRKTVRRTPLVAMIAAMIVLGAGCDIDVDVHELKAAREALSAFTNELEQISKPGGHLTQQQADAEERLMRILKTADTDLSNLIDKAETATDKERKKLVSDFIEQRRQTVIDILTLHKQIFSDARDLGREWQSGLLTVPREFDAAVKEIPKELVPELFAIVASIDAPLIVRNSGKRTLSVAGREIALQRGGRYLVTIAGDKMTAFSSLALLGTSRKYSAIYSVEGMAQFELPAEDFKPQFLDPLVNAKGAVDQFSTLPVELLGAGAAPQTRAIGNIRLKPLFPVKYSLDAAVKEGGTQSIYIQGGPALDDITGSITDVMRENKAPPSQIARVHAIALRVAEERLPYGTSKVTLPARTENWSLDVTNEFGKHDILNWDKPKLDTITVQWEKVSDRWTLFIRVDP